MVAAGAPLKVRPSNGELRDLLGLSFTRKVQGRSKEKIVRSAGWPGASVRSLPQNPGGPGVERSTTRIGGGRFVGTRFSGTRARAGLESKEANGCFVEQSSC